MDAGEAAWIDRFLAHLLNERRLSPHTESNYRRDLHALAGFCERENIGSWAGLDTAQVRRFAAAEHRRGLAARSVQRRLSAVRSFCNYLIREGELAANPAADVPAPKIGKHLPNTIDPDRMAALLEIPGDDPIAVRDLAIMELLYSSGLRLAELVGLDLNDLDLRDRMVRVTGKGDRTRIVPLGGKAANALRQWLSERLAWVRDERDAVFLSRSGRRLSPRSVQARVREWGKRRGTGVRVHPHLFRHSCATHVLESSGNLRAVQELLGHANLSTTQVYTHLDFQHLARIYEQTHPRARKRKP